VAAVTDAAIAAGIAALTGEIMQVPSAVSAIKVDGVRSYARVRSGDEVKLAPRPVTVYGFDRIAVRRAEGLIDLDVRVGCSSGTYIRALARDLGESLGVGGHLTALRRTRVGPYTSAEAVPLAELATRVEAGQPVPVLPIADAAGAAFPRYDADEEQARAIAHGGPLPARGLGPGPIAVFSPEGAFLALVEEQGRRCKPLAVFV
jgi:tRNA pseudouridine55 synthase